MARGLRVSEIAHRGDGAVIHPLARVVNAQNLSLGDHSSIDDFAFVNAGDGTRIGRYVHIGSHVSVIGRGGMEVGDYAVIATGARVLTATDTFTDGARMSTRLPDEFRHVVVGRVVIARDAFVGAGAVVLPGITIGEGAVVGAGAVVTKDCDPWTIYTGVPARPSGARTPPARPGP